MKKPYLLTSLLVLTLTSSLGGCSSTEQDLENIPADVAASTPSELISKVHDYCNYSIQLEYYVLQSSESVTYSEYSSEDFDINDNVLIDSLMVTSGYIIDLYYTIDTLAVDIYSYENGAQTYIGTDVFIDNNDGTFWEYVYPYNYSWGYRKMAGDFSSAFYSLSSAYDYGVQDDFTYYADGSVNGVSCKAYTLNEEAWEYLFYCLGTEFLFYDVDSAANSFNYVLTYYMDEVEEMLINYASRGYVYSGTLTEDTLIYAMDYEIYASVYDVYTTSDEYATYIHENIQAALG